MDLTPATWVEKKGHQGKGGLIGSIVGGTLAAIGAAAAPFTAGTSAALVPVGIGMAAAASPFVGEAIDPSKAAAQGDNTPIIDSEVKKTVPLDQFKEHPEVQLAQLQEARNALRTEKAIPTDSAQLIDNDFSTAQNLLRKRLNIANV